MDVEIQAQTQGQVENQAEKSVIEEARELADRIAKDKEEMKLLVARQEQLQAKQMLSGRAEAGFSLQKKELTPQEYAREVLQGKINPLKVDGE